MQVAVHALALGRARERRDLRRGPPHAGLVPVEHRHRGPRPGEPLEERVREACGPVGVDDRGERARERGVHGRRLRPERPRLLVEVVPRRGDLARELETVPRTLDERAGHAQVAGHLRAAVEGGPRRLQPGERRGHAVVALGHEPARHVHVRVLTRLERAQHLEDRAARPPGGAQDHRRVGLLTRDGPDRVEVHVGGRPVRAPRGGVPRAQERRVRDRVQHGAAVDAPEHRVVRPRLGHEHERQLEQRVHGARLCAHQQDAHLGVRARRDRQVERRVHAQVRGDSLDGEPPPPGQVGRDECEQALVARRRGVRGQHVTPASSSGSARRPRARRTRASRA